MQIKQINVLGGKLQECSCNPLTGFLRNGYCDSCTGDMGNHILCSIVNKNFLEFQLTKGNDLITPKKEFKFPGLKPGDKWCVCVERWLEAYNHSCAPSVVLVSSHFKVLEYIDIQLLKKFAIDIN